MPAAAHRAGAAGSMSDLQALGRLRRAAPAAVGAAIAAALLVAAGDRGRARGRRWRARPSSGSCEVALGLACATCAALGALIVAAIPRQRLGLALVDRRRRSARCGRWRRRSPRATRTAAAPSQQWAAWVENWAFIGLIVLVTWPLLLFPDGHLPSRRWRPGRAMLLVGAVAVDAARDARPGNARRRRHGPARRQPARHPRVVDLGRRARRRRRRDPVRRGRLDGRRAAARRAPARSRDARRAVGGARPRRQLRALDRARHGRRRARGRRRSTARRSRSRSRRSPLAGGRRAPAPPGARGRPPAAARVHRRRGRGGQLHRRSRSCSRLVGALAGDGRPRSAAASPSRCVAVPVRVRVRDRVDRLLYGHRDVSTAVRAHERASSTRAGDPARGAARPRPRGGGDARRLGRAARARPPARARAASASAASRREPALERELRHRGRSLGRLVARRPRAGRGLRARPTSRSSRCSRASSRSRSTRSRSRRSSSISRGQIVTAREEERRRLRRDLHDGLGPALAGIALTLQAAREHRRPARPTSSWTGAREQTAGRRRRDPPHRARRCARRSSTTSGWPRRSARTPTASRRSPSSSSCPSRRCRLSAAAELAVYRIATEALTNVVRHAHAQHVPRRAPQRRRRDRARGDRRRPRPRRPHADPGRRAALDARARRRARRPASCSARHARRRARRRASGCRTRGGRRMIRVLVVDDNAVFRQGMRDLFDSIAGPRGQRRRRRRRRRGRRGARAPGRRRR